MDAPASLCEPFVCGTNANSLRVVLPRSKEIGQVLQRHKGMFEVQRLGVGQTVESAGAGPGKAQRCSDGRGTERRDRGTKKCGDIGEQTTRAVCRWCPLPPPLWPPLQPPRLPLPLLCFTGRPAALLFRIRIIVPRRPASQAALVASQKEMQAVMTAELKSMRATLTDEITTALTATLTATLTAAIREEMGREVPRGD